MSLNDRVITPHTHFMSLCCQRTHGNLVDGALCNHMKKKNLRCIKSAELGEIGILCVLVRPAVSECYTAVVNINPSSLTTYQM